MTESHPPWLKRMQNGTIGEARARSFLIDRFWILERSVDIEGADFIIQRRITSSSLFDLAPPRLGIVQAKFYQSSATAHYVHANYVKGKDGKPRAEFFLLASTGYEDNTTIFLITAEEIVKSFPLMPPGTEHEGAYKLSGASMLVPAYQVVSPRISLQRMEHTLALVDIVKNRSFILPFIAHPDKANDAIDVVYTEKIDNAYAADIPRTFFSMRKTARKSLSAIEEARDYLHEIISTTDPLVALTAASDFDSMLDYYGKLELKKLYDPEFESEIKEYLSKLEQLKNAGLLDRYIVLRENLERFIVDHLCDGDTWTRDDFCILSLSINRGLEVLQSVFAKIQNAGDLSNNGQVKLEQATSEAITMKFTFVPARCRWSFPDSSSNPTWEETMISNARMWVATILYSVFVWIERGFCEAECLDGERPD